jgi:CRISP-associated protein Cas1
LRGTFDAQADYTSLLDKIIPSIEEILKAGGIDPPQDAPEAAEPVILREEASGNDGHRG